MPHSRCILAALTASILAIHTATSQPSTLSPVLFPESSDWQLGNYQSAKPDLSIALVDGEPAWRTGYSGLTLTSKKKLTGDFELRLRFRMTSPEDKGCYLLVRPGLPKADSPAANPLHVNLTVYPGPEPENLSWFLQPMPGKKDAVSGNYKIGNLPKNRLAWPDRVRRRLEADVAAEPRLTNRWITLRYQLRKNEARVYLDDRLLRAAGDPALDTSGFVQFAFTRGVEIASLSTLPLPAATGPFETVALEGYVNTDRFGTETLKLPDRGKVVTVGGVPFALPRTDAKKRDHIDLKPSWLACGSIPGDFYAIQSDLRHWGGALYRDPSRIQFRVPNGHYTKLHLLAAYTGEPDTTSTVTAQFYRDQGGAPVNFASKVPLFSAAAAPHALATTLTGGTKLNLHVVTIPLDPNGVSAFSDLDHLEFELTKQVRTFRGYPDPIQYSQHGAGLPSGVHVFGITLERPAVEVDFQPDAFAHVWTAPAIPGYTATLRNTSAVEQAVVLDLETRAFSRGDTIKVREQLKLAPKETRKVKLTLKGLTKYGHHTVRLQVTAGPEKQSWNRSLAYLHPDTREHGNWEEGKGPLFGFWDWNGGHITPSGMPRLKVMAQAGLESSMGSFESATYPADQQAFLASIGARTHFLAYQLAMTKDTLGGKEWDPKKPAEMQKALIDWLKKQPMAKTTKINKPELAVFFAEPLLGPVSYMSQPEHYGEPPHQLTPEEKAAYDRYLAQFLVAGQAIKKEWPNAKLLMPWGIPTFPIPFLRYSKEARDLMDGPALDVVLFERLPEMQLHQVTLSSAMWQLKQEWLKYGKPWPHFTTLEGPCVSPATPGALTVQEEADHTIRAFLVLAGYGNTRHLGNPVPFHCAGYWGETHYGTGLIDRLPVLTPRPVFSAYATMTRQLNRMNFVKQIHTGSNTVLCFQFKHYKTGELLHVVWTLRGIRGVSVAVAETERLTVDDSMDNRSAVESNNSHGTFTVSSAPCYLRGLKADAKLTLGAPVHSDVQPAAEAVHLGDLGDGTWKLSAERDLVYEDSHSEFIRRFPGKFSIKPTTVSPRPSGERGGGEGTAKFGKALSIHLEKQEKERKTMPFYTTLVPAKPIVIPGKASHLGLWVQASSDWGRVVYCLKDAKGERWISVGQKGEWNVDDTHCWSQFCFDGKRYLRFELPGNAPYDLFHEMGSTFWGHYGPGDGIVDYPLTLEKIIVERRTHVIAGTELVPASPDDVLLGGLYAEYESTADKTPEAVRQAALRMPLPAGLPELANPLKKYIDTGEGEGPTITKVVAPEREYDGRRCHVHFAPAKNAAKYDIWVSPYADGRGAVQLGTAWPKPGELLTGLSPNIDLYLFVVALDKAGKPTKPGKAFKINLKDMFPMK